MKDERSALGQRTRGDLQLLYPLLESSPKRTRSDLDEDNEIHSQNSADQVEMEPTAKRIRVSDEFAQTHGPHRRRPYLPRRAKLRRVESTRLV